MTSPLAPGRGSGLTVKDREEVCCAVATVTISRTRAGGNAELRTETCSRSWFDGYLIPPPRSVSSEDCREQNRPHLRATVSARGVRPWKKITQDFVELQLAACDHGVAGLL